MSSICCFVNLKSNSALLCNKGHNLLTSVFPQKLVKLIKFPFTQVIYYCLTATSLKGGLLSLSQASCTKMGVGKKQTTVWVGVRYYILDLKRAFFSPVFRPPLEYPTIWQLDTNLPFEYQTSLFFRWLLYMLMYLGWDICLQILGVCNFGGNVTSDDWRSRQLDITSLLLIVFECLYYLCIFRLP